MNRSTLQRCVYAKEQPLPLYLLNNTHCYNCIPLVVFFEIPEYQRHKYNGDMPRPVLVTALYDDVLVVRVSPETNAVTRQSAGPIFPLLLVCTLQVRSRRSAVREAPAALAERRALWARSNYRVHASAARALPDGSRQGNTLQVREKAWTSLHYFSFSLFFLFLSGLGNRFFALYRFLLPLGKNPICGRSTSAP